MNTRVWHQVCLELGDINVEGSIKTQRGSETGDDLRDETVEILVGGTFNVQVAAADVVKRLIVKAEGAIGVLQKCVL